jgi:magnesium-transporting ATPase (P-type)
MSLLFVMQLSLKIISKELTAKGILLKNSEYIDRLANISILLIDKEGSLFNLIVSVN